MTMGQPVEDRCGFCRALTGEDHAHDCANRPMEKSQVDRLFKQRSRKVTVHTEKGREVVYAPWVSAGEDLLTILESRLGSSVALLIHELAALIQATSASRSTDPDMVGSRSANKGTLSLNPVWADRRLDQLDRRLQEEAESVATWNHHPYDPNSRPGDCLSCGAFPERGDLYCRSCGEPTLRAFRRCGVCGQPRKDCRHTYRDLQMVDSNNQDML